MDRNELVNQLIKVVPNKNQLTQEEMEFYGFIHFGINTFTGREWGDGKESPSIFEPVHLDTDQWAEVASLAGMKGLILTCKHHDGFCLWPSKYTEHSVKNSPYKAGKGDIVKEFADSCKKYGLKMGVYLSPWDRNNAAYGYGEAYDDYFINQLTELLTGYGEVFTVWFDGACGEGSNGKKQYYNWNRYYELIRRLQPQATISICGPDIRWCGNEAGHTRKSEWSVVSATMADNEKIASDSQQIDSAEFREKRISSQDEDLGSVERLSTEKAWIWYPAEVDVSIRPGWFYHAEEDDKVKSPETLWNLYLKSVGGNAMLLLNLPPNKDGRIAKPDEDSLCAFGQKLKQTFSNNKLQNALLSYGLTDYNKQEELAKEYITEKGNTHDKPGCSLDNLREDNYETWFEPALVEETPFSIIAKWQEPQNIQYLVLKENIPQSQRVEEFSVYDRAVGRECIYTGTIIGHKRIIALDYPVSTNQIEICFEKYRVKPQISFLGIY